MKKRRHSSPGMFTVEAAILFPIIFFTIMGLIYISLVHYQNVVTRTAAMRTASRVSYCWDFLGAPNAWGFDDASGATQVLRPDYNQHDPYGAIVDGKRSTRLANSQAYFNWIMGRNPQLLQNETATNAKVEYHFNLLGSTVAVSVEKHYVNPFGHSLEVIGVGERQDTFVTAEAPVNDPVEFVRLAGLVYDTIKGR